MGELATLLLGFIRGQSLSFSQLWDLAPDGTSWDEMQDALAELVDAGKVVQFGVGYVIA